LYKSSLQLAVILIKHYYISVLGSHSSTVLSFRKPNAD